jgi:hypothetical protein
LQGQPLFRPPGSEIHTLGVIVIDEPEPRRLAEHGGHEQNQKQRKSTPPAMVCSFKLSSSRAVFGFASFNFQISSCHLCAIPF